jgi:hypothetical protein
VGPSILALCLVAGAAGAEPSILTTAPPGQVAGVPDLFSGTLALQASVENEIRAGETPLVAGTASQSFVAEILTPRLALELRRAEVVLSAWYGPRIFWEDPNPTSTSGPLVLHTLGTRLDVDPSTTLHATFSLIGAVGEPDYTALPQVLGTVQGTLPPLIELASLHGDARISDALTRLWSVSLGAQAFAWRWVDVPASPPPGTITSQILGSVEPSATLRLSDRDALQFATAVGAASYPGGVGLLTVSPATTWKRRLARRVDLNLRAGLAYAHVLGQQLPGAIPLLPAGKDSTVSPLGSAEIGSRIARRDNFLLQARAVAGVDFFVDPVLGVAIPRASTGAEVAALAVPDWFVSFRGDFATALRAPPAIANQPPPDETAFSLTLSGRRRLTDSLFAELGGRWADRGPTLGTPDFQFHQRQLWVFLSLTGTTRPLPRPSLPHE